MTENTITLSADDTTAAALVATIKAAVNGAGKYVAYVEAHAVTTDNVKDHARALASLAYPNDEPTQKKDGKRTRFGNAVQAAGNGLRAALVKDDDTDDEPKPAVLRLSLSGEGGGSTTIEPTHPLYADLVAMIAGHEA